MLHGPLVNSVGPRAPRLGAELRTYVTDAILAGPRGEMLASAGDEEAVLRVVRAVLRGGQQ